MKTTIFTKEVNTEDRNEMITFLKNHFRYFTMNSWNGMTSYANNVKLYNLQLPESLRNKAYDFLDAECVGYQYDIDVLINNFYNETGYTAGFNGRNSGYLVMYDTKKENGRLAVMAHGIDEYVDYEEWEDQELKTCTELVCKFDALCDDIRTTFIYYLENTNIGLVDVIRTETKKIARVVRTKNI